jgi:hypothetical protein
MYASVSMALLSKVGMMWRVYKGLMDFDRREGLPEYDYQTSAGPSALY